MSNIVEAIISNTGGGVGDPIYGASPIYDWQHDTGTTLCLPSSFLQLVELEELWPYSPLLRKGGWSPSRSTDPAWRTAADGQRTWNWYLTIRLLSSLHGFPKSAGFLSKPFSDKAQIVECAGISVSFLSCGGPRLSVCRAMEAKESPDVMCDSSFTLGREMDMSQSLLGHKIKTAR